MKRDLEDNIGITYDPMTRVHTPKRDNKFTDKAFAHDDGTPRALTLAKPCEGLCATCVHADACSYRARNESPVVYCEGFDTRDPAAVGPTTALGCHDDSTEALRKSMNASAELKGLCANCERQNTCTYHKLEGVVWHCEEYE